MNDLRVSNMKVASKNNKSSAKFERYSKMLELMVSDNSLEETLNFLLLQLESSIEGSKASFLLTSRDKSRFICTASSSLGKAYQDQVNELRVKKETGSCGAAITSKSLDVIENVFESEFWQPYLDFAHEKNIKSSWSYPIQNNDDEIIGSLDVYHKDERSPTEDELSIIKEISKLACLNVEHNNAKASYSLSSAITNYLPIGLIVCDERLNIIDVNPALCKISGYKKEEFIGRKPTFFSSSSHSMRNLFSILDKLDTGRSWTEEIELEKKSGETYISETCVTLIRDKDGKVKRSIASVTDITEKKRSEKTIEYQSNYDLLTHLPNRRSFYEQLNKNISRASLSDTEFHIMLLDLDHFKEINDSIGHEYGDKLLVLIAKRLEGVLEDGSIVSRLGGDEFGFILNSQYKHEKILKLANRILKKVSRPLSIKRVSDSYISSSIGIACYPKDGGNIEELLKSADQAMYQSKSKGRNSYTFFTKKLKDEAKRKANLHRELRIALYEKPEQFNLFFQPIVAKESAKLIQVESLLRWHHPTQGMISPIEFIPLAEKTGLACQLGSIVREKACEAASALKINGIKDVKVSINFSTDEFKNKLIYEQFLKLLEKHKLKPKDVVTEITESLFAEDEEQVYKTLKRFREGGIHIAIDDFGTGFSSLSYLAHFPADELKIDRSFITSIHTDSRKMSLVDSIINLGHSLGMYIVAEGVEEPEELEFLENKGCDLIQGYLIDKPLPLKILIEQYKP